MNTFLLCLRSPRHTVFEGPVDACYLRNEDGAMGILARHAPMVCALPAGIVRYQRGGKMEYAVTGAALLEISRSSTLIVGEFIQLAASEADARERLKPYTEWVKSAASMAEQF